MPKIELNFLGIGRRAKDGIPVLDKPAQIKQMVFNAANIWIKGKDSPEDKRKRHWKAAQKLLPLITPELVQDPSFYQKLNPKTHLGALRLLKEFVPDERSEEFESSSAGKVIVGYLKGFVDNRDLLPSEQDSFGRLRNPVDRDSAVGLLRRESNMPQYFLDQIFGKNVGLPPTRDRPGVPLEKKYEDVVRAPGEQQMPKSR